VMVTRSEVEAADEIWRSAENGPLEIGTEVVVVRLLHEKGNGQTGKVVSRDASTGEYTVSLRSGLITVRRCNIVEAGPSRRSLLQSRGLGPLSLLQGDWVDKKEPQCVYSICGWRCTRVAKTRHGIQESSFFLGTKGAKVSRGEQRVVQFDARRCRRNGTVEWRAAVQPWGRAVKTYTWERC